jgi:beta-glucanase (GH16 family)
MGTRIGGAAMAVVLALGPWANHAATAAKPGVRRPPVQGTFTDYFNSLDTTRWSKADGWKNGSPFDNAWRADHASILDGRLDLTLDDAATLGEPYSSGELRTNGYFGYGCYEASFKPVLVPGVVTSLFHVRRTLRQRRQRPAQRDRRRVPRQPARTRAAEFLDQR